MHDELHPFRHLCLRACVQQADKRDVTFLYTLLPGVCSKSYGMNVAHMAGVPVRNGMSAYGFVP